MLVASGDRAPLEHSLEFYFTHEWKLITITKTSHLDSLWRGGRHELGNGQFAACDTANFVEVIVALAEFCRCDQFYELKPVFNSCDWSQRLKLAKAASTLSHRVYASGNKSFATKYKWTNERASCKLHVLPIQKQTKTFIKANLTPKIKTLV